MMIRSFFALPLSEEAEQALSDARDGVQTPVERGLDAGASIRWVPPRNYHLTLAFLGNIRERDLEPLQSIAEEVTAAMRPDVFRLAALEWFPSALKPRLLVAVPEHCESLIHLQRELSRALRRAGFQLEKRLFRPHITLARVRNLSRTPDLRDEPLDIDCELDEVVLFASEQSRHGVTYSPLFVEPIQAYP